MKCQSLVLLLWVSSPLLSQTIIPLWPEGVPNQTISNEKERQKEQDIIRIENVQTPTLEVYLPSKATQNGTAVVICPGGGYKILAYDWEGTDIAKWFNAKGITAFVLKYRLPNSPSLIKPQWAPLQDAQRAMRLVRKNAVQWNINTAQIGIMGFSAGGHLASTLGTHFDENTLTGEKENPINNISARPDFMILAYPVITFDKKHYHGGSKNSLIGEKASQQLVDYFSNNLQKKKKTPPTFLVHSADDKSVPVANSILFFKALEKQGISVEMHLYPKGGHGYSLALGKGRLEGWTERLHEWLNELY